MTVVMTFLLAAGLIGLAGLTACEGSKTGMQEEYGLKGEVEEGKAVEIELRSDRIDAPREVKAGKVTFAIKNQDSKDHVLTIEREGEAIRQGEQERMPVRPGMPPEIPGMIEPDGQNLGKNAIQNVRPGETLVFAVTLIPGEYRIYSPEASGELETILSVVEERG